MARVQEMSYCRLRNKSRKIVAIFTYEYFYHLIYILQCRHDEPFWTVMQEIVSQTHAHLFDMHSIPNPSSKTLRTVI